MKKRFTSKLAAMALACAYGVSTTVAQGVYQLPNPDFELWEKGVKLDGSITTHDEPVGWNSFGTATGSFVSFTKHSITKGEQAGNKYALITSCELTIFGFLKVKANGNMTTGIVNAGGTSATDKNNHNYTVSPDATNAGADNFRQKFTGCPDALKVKLKYIPNSGKAVADSEKGKYEAEISAWIHNNNKFQTPYESEIEAKAVASAIINPKYDNAREWTEFIQPFDYSAGNAENTPAYILITAGTHKTPGEGTTNDSLFIDDVYFVYYSSLSDLKINNTSIEGFDENITTYYFNGKAPEISAVEAIKKGHGGLVNIASGTKKDNSKVTTITITVKGDDYEANPQNATAYNLVYTDEGSTNIDETNSTRQYVNIYTHNKSIYITGYNGDVEIYDLNGISVVNKKIEGDSGFELASGTYIVRAGFKSATVIVK